MGPVLCGGGDWPAPGTSKETAVIETNVPITEPNEQTKPTESDLVQTARDAGAVAQERLGDFRDAALVQLGRSEICGN